MEYLFPYKASATCQKNLHGDMPLKCNNELCGHFVYYLWGEDSEVLPGGTIFSRPGNGDAVTEKEPHFLKNNISLILNAPDVRK